MGRIYKFLGLSVGIVVHGLTDRERQRSYRSRHHLRHEQRVRLRLPARQHEGLDRALRAARAATTRSSTRSTRSSSTRRARRSSSRARPRTSADLYQKVNAIIPRLRKDIDYTVDEKAHSAILTDSGVERVEQRLGVGNLYDPENIEWLHHVTQALRAHTLYKRDVNYLVEEGKVLIVDEFTGRKMPGRRWSDGLHQAIEAKEGVEVQEENQTLATITFQNYFRIYKKLAGMTGTADTEAAEFHQIYKLDVTVVPTNKPIVREDHARRRLQERARQVPRGHRRDRGLPRARAAGARRYRQRREVRGRRVAAAQEEASRTTC